MRKHLFTLTLLILGSYLTRGFGQSTPEKGIRLSGDTSSMGFTVFKYFPFIDATINGVKGWLLFDTGAQISLEVDDKVLGLKNGKNNGGGFVGSGQKFEVNLYDTLKSVELDHHLKFDNVRQVRGHDFSYMKSITDGILGLTGYDFFKGYLFKMDYKRNRISFYKDTPQRRKSRDFLKKEEVVGIIDFTIRKLPNHPVVQVVIDSDTLAVSFDTGQLGGLHLTEEVKKRWLEKGRITLPEKGSEIMTPSGIPLTKDLIIKPGAMYLETSEDAAPANKSIGIHELNGMTLGYSFLSTYKVIWDFGERKLYLLKP